MKFPIVVFLHKCTPFTKVMCKTVEFPIITSVILAADSAADSHVTFKYE